MKIDYDALLNAPRPGRRLTLTHILVIRRSVASLLWECRKMRSQSFDMKERWTRRDWNDSCRLTAKNHLLSLQRFYINNI
jgi:hypothetical protein